jgi:hypothetical protein
MKQEGAPSEPRKQETIEARRKSLLELTKFGEMFAEREVIHINLKKDDETLKQEIQERDRVVGIIASRLKEIKQGLSDPALFKEALDASYELVCTMKFGRQVGVYIADAGPIFAKEFEDVSPHTAKMLQVMREAFQNQSDHGEMPDPMPRNATRLRDTLLRSREALGLYFSEANTPKPHERFERIAALSDIIKVLGTENVGWASDTIVDILASAIKSKDYRPDYTSEKILDLMGSKKKGETLPELPYGSITRADIETVCQEFDRNEGIEIVRSIFTRFGLPRTMYDELTQHSSEDNPLPLHFDELFARSIDQLEALQALEVERPGSVRELYRRFGIRWFGRYPTDVLVEQYDERDSAERPYGVFASGVADWNYSFFTANDLETVDQLHGDLSQRGYALRVIECNSKNEFASLLEDLHRTYGGQHKIEFMIVRGHAHRDRMEFGTGAVVGDLDVEDLKSKNYADRLRVFSENPTIIFDGCSVGRKGGLAQTMSEVYGATVFAPKGMISSLTDIKVEGEKNKVSFAPEYAAGTKKDLGVHVYVRGRKR